MQTQAQPPARLAAEPRRENASHEWPDATGNAPANASLGASSPKSPWTHYAIACGTFAGVTVLNLGLEKWIGHPAVAFVYLLAMVWLALFVGRGPILLGTVLTALGWSYFFAPPKHSFRIDSSTDQMMVLIYFFVSLTVAQLTARLRAQRDAEVRHKLLAESERLGRTLLNSVSHELRTPIAAIDSAASGLRSCGALSPAQQNLAGEIESASLRLNRVVQSLLSAARIQSGLIRPNPDWCDVRDIIRAALSDAGELSRHPVEKKIPDGLPLAKVDFVLVEQALMNLLVNAAAHTPPGTPVQISARVGRKELILEVADRGPGLPPDQLERIFELFHRTPTARPGGTGLGLAIVKGFIESQGGRVEAANRPDGGAVFTIRLPAVDVPDLPEETLA
jgi:K+-sensing histidine kinase KdpD